MPLSFKPFHEMTPEDYADIGLKVGLEVHQQLLTRRKLFCRCPAGRYSNQYDAEILRHMRPTLSELGEYDGTALMEKKTKKNIYYRIHHDTVCTYEFDDTPPFFMDEEALDIALEVALLLRLNLVSELHIARKQYLDGSIPTGFQRTTILGVDGWIPYKGRKIRIKQLGLEEDACREVSDVGHDRVFLTDRLGMPLIEPVTYPDIHTPQEAAEVGQIIRMLCRSTGKVRTGYGAARQDVNVSVSGGTRVEIKGTPQLWRNPRLIYNEARRQCSLLYIRDELRARGVRSETFQCSTQDVTRIVAKSEYEPIRAALGQGKVVKCVLLKGFGALLNEPTQEHTTFAKEFADRARVIACLTRLPNIIHSDAASESLAGREWKDLRRKMRAQHGDTLILAWGAEEDAACACREIVIRAREATEGVPSDTRQGLKDGSNGFERVLPGAERMYPDTDLPPLAIDQARLDRIKARLPEYVWERLDRYRRLHLPEDVLQPLCTSRRANLFDRLVSELETDPTFAAVVLMQYFKAFKREGLAVERLTEEEIHEVFKAHAEGRLAREGVIEVLAYLAGREPSEETGAARVAKVFEELHLSPANEEEIEQYLARQLGQLDESRFATPTKMCRYLIGLLMREFLGRFAGRRIAQLVHDRLQVAPEGETEVKART
ncbi:MAG: Glu-tRNA(Gln) amidotransferase subunit GatE [Phycisphaerae bacterium]|nr:Glu-tRNA(Gln) amidotransferase subunit GatE [Phycisphaerae bacterium]